MATSSYPIINNIPCKPEIQVSFKTYNRTDSQTYYGTIVGSVNYLTASRFGDIDAIHGNMKPSVAKLNITSLAYLLVKTTDGAIRPFAVDWIDPDTFKQTDNAADVHLVVHNISTTDAAMLITTIRDMGFDVSEAKL